ncbi:(2Fe-2S) ferredoxin domain-containing protein [uncultured Amnibacterium sp.]|uniref:(2Fe-2S) ferredoxin domain-containing protein n=1 Tax=uncultured Amnibacterium sp. TaxID=1631851 RepID=UPI0035CBA883
MSRRLDRWRGRLEADQPEVVVCRGGDCGSRRTHPRVDHAGQLARLREALDGQHATVVASRCLDACDRSNVVVVSPGRQGREAGIEPVWFGEVLDEAATEAVVDWVASGDARTEPPPLLGGHRFDADRRSRRDLSTRRAIPGRRARERPTIG